MNQNTQPQKPSRPKIKIWLWTIVISVAVIAPIVIFMLVSTFGQKEPVIVDTPTAVTEEKVSDASAITIIVVPDDNGKAKVFLSLDVPAKVKREILNQAVTIYNGQEFSNKGFPISITGEGVASFLDLNVIDTSIGDLPALLEGLGCSHAGIPIDDNKDIDGTLNDFQIWCRAILEGAKQLHDENGDENDLYTRLLKDGTAIAIKADKDMPFDAVNLVFDNLQTMGLSKFTLMTSLR